MTAMATKTTRATKFSGSPMVNDPIGGTRNQFTSSDAATAVTAPTTHAAQGGDDHDESEEQQEVGGERERVARRASSTSVSRGRSDSAPRSGR